MRSTCLLPSSFPLGIDAAASTVRHVDPELLQQLALDPSRYTGNAPAHQAHLDDCDELAVRFKPGEIGSDP